MRFEFDTYYNVEVLFRLNGDAESDSVSSADTRRRAPKFLGRPIFFKFIPDRDGWNQKVRSLFCYEA